MYSSFRLFSPRSIPLLPIDPNNNPYVLHINSILAPRYLTSGIPLSIAQPQHHHGAYLWGHIFSSQRSSPCGKNLVYCVHYRSSTSASIWIGTESGRKMCDLMGEDSCIITPYLLTISPRHSPRSPQAPLSLQLFRVESVANELRFV